MEEPSSNSSPHTSHENPAEPVKEVIQELEDKVITEKIEKKEDQKKYNRP